MDASLSDSLRQIVSRALVKMGEEDEEDDELTAGGAFSFLLERWITVTVQTICKRGGGLYSFPLFIIIFFLILRLTL